MFGRHHSFHIAEKVLVALNPICNITAQITNPRIVIVHNLIQIQYNLKSYRWQARTYIRNMANLSHLFPIQFAVPWQQHIFMNNSVTLTRILCAFRRFSTYYKTTSIFRIDFLIPRDTRCINYARREEVVKF